MNFGKRANSAELAKLIYDQYMVCQTTQTNSPAQTAPVGVGLSSLVKCWILKMESTRRWLGLINNGSKKANKKSLFILEHADLGPFCFHMLFLFE